MVDAARGLDQDTMTIIERLKAGGRRAVLALNKVDLVQREKLLPLAQALHDEGIFEPLFMISAENGDGVGDLEAHLAAAVPEGPWLYPEDQLSDMPQRLLAAEITREQVFRQLHDELPYASTVETEAWEEFKNGSAKLQQTIYVQRDSQKAIVLGQGGRQIKKIGARAREELELVFDRRIHLFLHVKVREGWLDDRERYEALGLEFD
jgi:GTPase